MKVYVVLKLHLFGDEYVEVLDEIFSSEEKAKDYIKVSYRPADYTIVEKEVL